MYSLWSYNLIDQNDYYYCYYYHCYHFLLLMLLLLLLQNELLKAFGGLKYLTSCSIANNIENIDRNVEVMGE